MYRVSLAYSHSIVAGGFDVMSYTTRLTLSTSLTMRTLIFVPRDAHPVGCHAIDRCYDADAYGVGVSAYYRVNYYSFTTLFGISIVAGEMTNSIADIAKAGYEDFHNAAFCLSIMY